MLAPSCSCCEHDMKTCRRQAAWDMGWTVNTPRFARTFIQCSWGQEPNGCALAFPGSPLYHVLCDQTEGRSRSISQGTPLAIHPQCADPRGGKSPFLRLQ